MTMRKQQQSVPNTLRNLYLLTTFLFASLCTCCDACFNDTFDKFKESNVSMTAEYGGRDITAAEFKQYTAHHCTQGFEFNIKISTKNGEDLSLEDLDSVVLKVKNQKNVSQLMYASSFKREGATRVIFTSYDTIYNNGIALTKLLAMYQELTKERYDFLPSNIVVIPQDKTLPCSLTLELEVDGKSIDEFVNVSGKLGGTTSGHADVDMALPELEKGREVTFPGMYYLGSNIHKNGFVCAIELFSKNDEDGFVVNDLTGITLKLKSVSNLAAFYECASETNTAGELVVKPHSSSITSSIKLNSLVAVSSLDSSQKHKSKVVDFCAIPNDDSCPCYFELELEKNGKSLGEPVKIRCLAKKTNKKAKAPTVYDQESCETLGLDSSIATQESIKEVYYSLMKKYHPDKNPGDPSVLDNFHKVQQAYKKLMNSSESP